MRHLFTCMKLVSLLLARPAAALVLALAVTPATAEIYSEQYGKLDIHFDHYWQTPTTSGQQSDFVVVDAKAGLLVEQDRYQLLLEPRLSGGTSGSGRADLIEGHISYRGDDFDLLIGNSVEFWGKVESFNPVDILNSYDYTRGLTRGQKRGAPMIKLSTQLGPGQLDSFILPQFAENDYPGMASRLRPALLPVNETASYSGGAKRGEVGHALRWSGYYGDLDIGLSYFAGIGREPRLLPQIDGRLRPDYSRIIPTGIDGQYLFGDTALKGEFIHRTGQYDRHGVMKTYRAAIIGLEHNIYDLAASGYDLVLLAEFATDSRQLDSHTGFQNDLIGGGRLLLNDIDDSEIMLLLTHDLDYTASTARLSYNTRLSDNLVVKSVISLNENLARDANNAAFAQDQYAGVTLSYSW